MLQIIPAPVSPDITTSVLQQLLHDATARKWFPLVVVVIGLLTQFASKNSKWPWPNVEARYQPIVALVLGQVYAVLESIQSGTPWTQAALHGVEVAFLAMGAYDIAIKTACGGTLPAWLAWLTRSVQPVPTSVSHEKIETPRDSAKLTSTFRD